MANIPVLCFHKITTRFEWGLTTYHPERFEKLIVLLIENGYQFWVPGQTNSGPKKVMLTFDDGYQNVYDNALPVLKRFQIPFIVFPVIDYIGKENRWDANLGGITFHHLDKNQIEEIIRSGGLVGSHGMSHTAFSLLTEIQKRREIDDSFDFLRQVFGVTTRYFSPPFGESLKDKNIFTKIDYSFILDNKTWDVQNKEISRIPVYRYETPEMVLKKLENPGINHWISGKIHLGARLSIQWQRYRRR